MTKQTIDIGKNFLTEFIKQLIIESKDHLPKQKTETTEKISKSLQKSPTYQMKKLRQEEITDISKIPNNSKAIEIPRKKPLVVEIGINPKRQVRNLQRPTQRIPIIKPKAGYIDLGKLNFLVADPWVQSIECQGPNRNITVKKGNKIFSTNIILTDGEINKIIDEFSLETKIPLAEGMLSALYNNLMITAIVSDTIGGRFVIQKTNPHKLTI